MADIIRPIEPFQLTQGFGENPANYARFGLKGHNGWDLKTKFEDTPLGRRYILASWLMKFYKQGDEGNDGYGKYFDTICKLLSTWKLTFAHCHSIESFDEKSEGDHMAISDNTGNSTGSHLHLTVKRVSEVNGKYQVLENDNGFFGAVNPQEFFDELREYKKNLSSTPKPTTPEVITPQTKIFVGKDNDGNFWGDSGYMEVQAIRSTMNDLKRDKNNLQNALLEHENKQEIPSEEISQPTEVNETVSDPITTDQSYDLIPSFIAWVRKLLGLWQLQKK